MTSKFRTFWQRLFDRIKKKRKENLIARNKVQKIALYQTEERAAAFVKRETDGDGGWRPQY
jgi:hypothetical protein